MNSDADKKLIRKKRIVAVFSLVIVICVAIFLTYFTAVKFMTIGSSGVEFREFLQSYGAYGVFVAIGLQIIQVFIAIIPGEVVEVGLGYAYGWLGGTALCLFGVAVGSSIIFLLVKKFGIRLIELFVSVDKINELKLINNEKKLHRLTFILFFIPGTPKDIITYFIGLTRMTLGEFLAITMFARIPSVVSSTIGGNFIGNGQYLQAIILFVVTGVVSFAGMKLYDVLINRIKKRAEKLRGKSPLKKIKTKINRSDNTKKQKGGQDIG